MFQNDILRVAIEEAVLRGVSVETVLMLLLFPVTAALVAFSRHVIGFSGFGIFVPILVTIAFVYSGVLAGFLLFLVIILTASFGRVVVRRLKLPYLPRMAVLLWLLALGALLLLLVAPILGMEGLVKMTIFPILFFMMLTEENIEAQITRTWQAAVLMTVETLFIAILGSAIIGNGWVRGWFLTNPTFASLAVLGVDMLIGKYKGLRLMEVWRFRKLIKS